MAASEKTSNYKCNNGFYILSDSYVQGDILMRITKYIDFSPNNGLIHGQILTENTKIQSSDEQATIEACSVGDIAGQPSLVKGLAPKSHKICVILQEIYEYELIS